MRNLRQPERGSWYQGQLSLVGGTPARATHGLSNGLFRFFSRNRSAVSIYLRKITFERIDDFLSPFV